MNGVSLQWEITITIVVEEKNGEIWSHSMTQQNIIYNVSKIAIIFGRWKMQLLNHNKIIEFVRTSYTYTRSLHYNPISYVLIVFNTMKLFLVFGGDITRRKYRQYTNIRELLW